MTWLPSARYELPGSAFTAMGDLIKMALSLDSSHELLSLPGPRQQTLELVGLGPARDHALEHVGQLSS